jgi:predicted nucleic-acid-binding Zn-ribbon protein
MADPTISTAPLPPFSGDRPTCAKCGHVGALVSFTSDGFACGGMSRLASVDAAERLCRTCERCGYHWDEATATNDDAAPFRGRVPLGQQFRVELVFVGENSPGETHMKIVHEPSGLHHALSCVSATSAKAAKLPVLMFQALLDDVDAWGRQPLGGAA